MKTDENIPVKSSSREMFLHLFLFATLYISFYSLGSVIFSFIELIGVATFSPLDFRASDIRSDVATLLVMFPIFCGTAYYIMKHSIPGPRFLALLSFFLAGLVFASTLACVVYYFLQGEATGNFLLKVITASGSEKYRLYQL